jgi:hypothetical protein
MVMSWYEWRLRRHSPFRSSIIRLLQFGLVAIGGDKIDSDKCHKASYREVEEALKVHLIKVVVENPGSDDRTCREEDILSGNHLL